MNFDKNYILSRKLLAQLMRELGFVAARGAEITKALWDLYLIDDNIGVPIEETLKAEEYNLG